jgi:hypothetical protein
MDELNELLKLLMNLQGKFSLYVHCIVMAQEAQQEFLDAIVAYNDKSEKFLTVKDLEEYLKQSPKEVE